METIAPAASAQWRSISIGDRELGLRDCDSVCSISSGPPLSLCASISPRFHTGTRVGGLVVWCELGWQGSERLLHFMCPLALLALLALLAGCAHASLLPGDPITLLWRSQTAGRRSDWLGAPFNLSPRFMQDMEANADIFLPHIHSSGASAEPVKVSFAFGRDLQHMTPWITLIDANKVIQRLQLRLVAAGDALTEVSFEAFYGDGDVPPEHIVIHTFWDRADEHDLGAALGVLFLAAACLTFGLLYWTCRRHRGAVAVAKLLLLDGDEDYSVDDRAGRSHYARRSDGVEVYDPYEWRRSADGDVHYAKRE